MNEKHIFLGRMQPKTRDYIKNLERENRMLEHNWNELKRVLKEMYIHTQYTGYLDIIYKMQELEEGGNNDC